VGPHEKKKGGDRGTYGLLGQLVKRKDILEFGGEGKKGRGGWFYFAPKKGEVGKGEKTYNLKGKRCGLRVGAV